MNALNLLAKPTAPKCCRRLNEKSKVKHSICIYDPSPRGRLNNNRPSSWLFTPGGKYLFQAVGQNCVNNPE